MFVPSGNTIEKSAGKPDLLLLVDQHANKCFKDWLSVTPEKCIANNEHAG